MKHSLKLLAIGTTFLCNTAQTSQFSFGKCGLEVIKITSTLVAAVVLKNLGVLTTEESLELISRTPQELSKTGRFKQLCKDDTRDIKNGLLTLITLGNYKVKE